MNEKIMKPQRAIIPIQILGCNPETGSLDLKQNGAGLTDVMRNDVVMWIIHPNSGELMVLSFQAVPPT